MGDRKEPTPPSEGQKKPDPPPAPPPRVADRQAPVAPQVNPAVAGMVKRDDTMAVAFQGLVPSSIGEAMQLAAHLAKSSAIPSTLRGNPETVFTVIMAGMEIGLTPIRAIQQITNIKGRLCMAADLQLAQVRRSGTLDYFNEGFELANETDGDGSLGRRLKAAKCPDPEDTEQLILDLTDNVPEGKPYGWACIKRKGDPQLHVRVFTWVDADRVDIRETDDDGKEGTTTKKKLSEKTNYRNYPQDMYPKRARARVMQLTHSDVTAGMPAVEAMEGAYIEGEVVSSEIVKPTSSEDTIDTLLAAVRATDNVAATSILAGFEQLQLGIAKRLQLLKQYQGNSQGLLTWLKDEYANRATRGKGRQQKDVLSNAQAASTTQQQGPAQQDQPAERIPPVAATSTARDSAGTPAPPSPPAQNQNPGREVREGGMESVKSIADKFKAVNLPSF